MIKEGSPFPDFALPDQDGRSVALTDLAGKWLVIFVYPKDDTPGCTAESKEFSAAKATWDATGVRAVGVSQDDVASHKNFCDKHALTVTLLSDTGGKLLSALGVGRTEYGGTYYWDRTTFLVDPRGIVRKVYSNVQPQGHEREVLADLTRLRAAG